MKKNVASQFIGVQMTTAADGTDFAGAVTCTIAKDGAAPVASGGTGPTLQATGYYEYSPSQAETNYDHIAFHFVGTGAISVTLQVYTQFPQTGDTYALANGATGFAAIDTVVDTINTNVGTAGAGLTNIGTVATVTTLTNLPAIPANWLTAAGIAAAALNGKGDWNINKTGYTVSTVSDKTGYSISGTKQTLDALNDITAANVNAEVVDALNVDTYAEPGQGVPAATTSIAAKINYLYKVWRNKKTSNATTIEIYNDAGTVVDQKRTIAYVNPDYTEDETISGP